MEHHHTTLIYTFVVFFVLSVACTGKVAAEGDGTMRKICPPKLANKLYQMCNLHLRTKKVIQDYQDDFSDYMFDQNDEVFLPLMFPAKTDNHLNGYSNSVLNKRGGGIIDECCRKPCSERQLLAYCYSYVPGAK